MAISAVLLLAGLFSIVYLLSSQKNEAGVFRAFEDHYLGIMKSLDSNQCKLDIALELGGEYNFTELFAWEHSKLTFESDPAGWFEDPFEILSSGKGTCAQFSIVYVSACLALDIQSRLVVAANTTTWAFIHVWSEVYINGSWVHVDPSEVWNQPSRYQNWDWGKSLGQDVRVYAFQDGKSEDVTSTYNQHSD